MTFDLLGDIKQHFDFALLRIANNHTFQDAPHPACAFTAGRALAAALVLEEIRNARNRTNDISRFVHHNCGCRSERGFDAAQAIEIHRAIDDVSCRYDGT